MDLSLLKDLLSSYKSGHTNFQCDHFIVGKSGTKYGQYKQALAELYKRWTALREMTCNKEKAVIECDKEKYESENNEDPYVKKLSAIEHKRQLMQLEEIDRNINTVNREFLRFYQHAASLHKHIFKNDDVSLEELEKEQWLFSLKCKAAIDFASSGRISSNVYEAIISCPKDVRSSIMKDIQNPQELIVWFENVEDNEIELIEVDENFNVLDVDIMGKTNLEDERNRS